MNKFEFKKFKKWFFEQTETYVPNQTGEWIPVQVPYYQIKTSNRCLRETGFNRNYNFDSWKYFSTYGNKNFIIDGEYIEFDTPVDEHGNPFYDSCRMFYLHNRLEGPFKYKHIRIHYHKFCYPLSRHSEGVPDNLLHWD